MPMLPPKFKNYVIKEGKHYSGLRIRPFFDKKKKICYEVVFNESCLYGFGDEDEFAINKLFGFSAGLHHKNSARFGWRADGNEIEISSYCYKNKKRNIKTIRNVEIDKIYIFSIENAGTNYEFKIMTDLGNIIGYAGISKLDTVKFGYELFPYFGGDKTAPHKIEIHMRRIKL